jgi:ppGpp synthetase/RelA/SpoT-type nucleotidyltranferase
MSSTPIERFLADSYPMLRQHRNKLAEAVKRDSAEKLEEYGIDAIVTSSVKSKDSLRRTLEAINTKRIRAGREGYERPDSVLQDIANVADLAGVRIALYFPRQQDLAVEVISKEFNIVNSLGHEMAGNEMVGNGMVNNETCIVCEKIFFP